MNTSSVKVGLARYKKITWQIIHTENVINWVLGIALILVPDFFNRLLFGHEVLSHWIYILFGLALLWGAVWQVDNFIKPRTLSVPALRLAAILSWLVALVLSWLLFSTLSQRLLLSLEILLWLSDLLLLVTGGWYWWVSSSSIFNSD